MASKIYDIELDCGCLITLDAGGGVMSCCYPEVASNEELERCRKAWVKYYNSSDYEKHQKEIIRRNQ